MPKKEKTKAIAKKETAVAKQEVWSDERLKLVRDTTAKGLNESQLKLFLYTAQKTGLDPLTRQIYAIMRKSQKDGKWEETMSIQTGIDGLRVIAERSRNYAGQTRVEYSPKQVEGRYPEWAEVGVYRKDCEVPIYARAYWNEYVQRNSKGVAFMWSKMPFLMLGKCAEALALRKAFPNDMAGLYTSEEMQQSDNILEQVEKYSPDKKIEAPKVEAPKEMITEQQKKDIATLASDLKVEMTAILSWLKVKALEELTEASARVAIDKLAERLQKPTESSQPSFQCEVCGVKLSSSEIDRADNSTEEITVGGKKMKYLCSNCYKDVIGKEKGDAGV